MSSVLWNLCDKDSTACQNGSVGSLHPTSVPPREKWIQKGLLIKVLHRRSTHLIGQILDIWLETCEYLTNNETAISSPFDSNCACAMTESCAQNAHVQRRRWGKRHAWRKSSTMINIYLDDANVKNLTKTPPHTWAFLLEQRSTNATLLSCLLVVCGGLYRLTAGNKNHGDSLHFQFVHCVFRETGRMLLHSTSSLFNASLEKQFFSSFFYRYLCRFRTLAAEVDLHGGDSLQRWLKLGWKLSNQEWCVSGHCDHFRIASVGARSWYPRRILLYDS